MTKEIFHGPPLELSGMNEFWACFMLAYVFAAKENVAACL